MPDEHCHYHLDQSAPAEEKYPKLDDAHINVSMEDGPCCSLYWYLNQQTSTLEWRGNSCWHLCAVYLNWTKPTSGKLRKARCQGSSEGAVEVGIACKATRMRQEEEDRRGTGSERDRSRTKMQYGRMQNNKDVRGQGFMKRQTQEYHDGRGQRCRKTGKRAAVAGTFCSVC